MNVILFISTSFDTKRVRKYPKSCKIHY